MSASGANLNAAIPASPMVWTNTGEARIEWRLFFDRLWRRTGGSPGTISLTVPQVQASLGYPMMQGLEPAGGYTSSPYPFGTMNECSALSCQMWPPDASGRPTMPQIGAFWSRIGPTTYSSRDMCTFYCGASSSAPQTITVSSANYTATTMIPSPPLTTAQVSFIQQAIAINNQRAPLIPAGFDNIGMLIDTQHTPTKYTGAITAVAADGSSVTVLGWYPSPTTGSGSTTPGQVPSSGVGAYINPVTKIWNMDGVMMLNAGDFCQQMAFLEIDAYNYQPAFSGGVIPTIGVSANAHANGNGYAFVANGNWYSGFLAQGNTYSGFLIHPTANAPAGTDMNYGYVSQVRSDITGGHHPFAYYDFSLATPGYRWFVGGNGSMNLGAPAYDNGLSIGVSASGSPPIIQAQGPDTNINVRLHPQGTGLVQCDGGIRLTSGAGPTWTSGAGAPSSTQPVGSLYSNTSGAVGATLYVSRGGGTWNAVAGV